MSDAWGAFAQGLGGLKQGLQSWEDRFYQADYMSQYSRGLAEIEKAYSVYNQDLHKKKWDLPQGADGSMIPNTFGQIDESRLLVDHQMQDKEARDIVMRTTTNNKARDQLATVLEQKAASNWSQVRGVWMEAHEREMIQDSDRIIEGYMNSTATPDKKKLQIKNLLTANVGVGLRTAGDAAAYEQKLYDQVDTTWAFEQAMDVARKSGMDPAVSDKWISDPLNTPFWNNRPEEREKLKKVARDAITIQRDDLNRLNKEFDDKADAQVEQLKYDVRDSIPGLKTE
jgi:hypothetical protein